MNHPLFNREHCIACGACAAACPFRIIGFEAEGFPAFRDDAIACMACGHCAAVCPADAVTVRAQSAGSAQDAGSEAFGPKSEIPADNPALALIMERRSYRSFAETPVPRKLIERAIDAARYAASAKNAQGSEWTVIEGRERIQEAGLGLTAKLRENPALEARYKYVRKDEDAVFWGASALVIAHGDPAASLFQGDGVIAATAFDYAAQALGLATCFSGTAMNAQSLVKSLAGIPEAHAVYAVLMVGLPGERYLRLPDRKAARVTWR